MKPYFAYVYILSLCVLPTSALYAAQPTIAEVEGYACMGAEFSRKDTEKNAMADAKRKAAEQTITYIKSETRVKDSQLDKDIIDAYTHGTVKVLETKASSWYKDPQTGDCYKIAIKAEVIPDAEGIKKVANKRDKAEGLSFNVNYVYRPQGRGDLLPIKKGDILSSGDHYKIIFSPDKESYVYIFQVDSAGQVFQLFPLKGFKGSVADTTNPVKSGKTYILPAADKAFTLDKQSGLERIYFIASQEQDSELEGLYAEVQKGRAKGAARNESAEEKLKRLFSTDADTPVQAATVIPENDQKKRFKKRGVEGIASDSEVQVPWSESGDLFSVMGQKLENLGSESIHVLEFVHQ